VQTQWNVGFGGPIGLRYEGCAAVLERFPELDRPEVWIGLELIEAAFLADQGRRAKKEKDRKGRGGEGAGGGKRGRRG
jgi:hypothetical protein